MGFVESRSVHKLIEFPPFCIPVYFPSEQRLCQVFSYYLKKTQGPPVTVILTFPWKGHVCPLETLGMNTGHPDRTLLQAHSGCSGDTNTGGERSYLNPQLGSERLILAEPSEH